MPYSYDEQWVTIDGADYVPHDHEGKMYYIGEESILDETKTEIGFISVRGPIAVIVATNHGETIDQRVFNDEEQELLETEDDVIKVILELHKCQAEDKPFVHIECRLDENHELVLAPWCSTCEWNAFKHSPTFNENQMDVVLAQVKLHLGK